MRNTLGLLFLICLFIPIQESLKSNKGCCYSVGFGDLMKPVYGNYESSAKHECKTIERIGGATRHINLSCYELKKIHNKKII